MPTSAVELPFSEVSETFQLYIDYSHEQPDAARVFVAMGGLLQALADLDRSLARAVAEDAEVTYTLAGIEAASLLSIPEVCVRLARGERLGVRVPGGAVLQYLGRARDAVMGFLCARETVHTPDELAELQHTLRDIAAEEHVDETLEFTPPSDESILGHLQQLGAAQEPLAPDDRLEYRSRRVTVTAETRFTLSDERIAELRTARAEEGTGVEVLVVKKPDYLGNSKWQFRADNRMVEAAVNDTRWLRRFQAREVDLRPGDAIRARVQRTVRLARDGKVVAETVTVQQVLDVLRGNDARPETLPLEGAA